MMMESKAKKRSETLSADFEGGGETFPEAEKDKETYCPGGPPEGTQPCRPI